MLENPKNLSSSPGDHWIQQDQWIVEHKTGRQSEVSCLLAALEFSTKQVEISSSEEGVAVSLGSIGLVLPSSISLLKTGFVCQERVSPCDSNHRDWSSGKNHHVVTFVLPDA